MLTEEAPKFDDKLLSLEYLIFSSHKSATQSISHSLTNSGVKCRHCHYLRHIDIKEGSFQEYLNNYLIRNKKKLIVITVFREPIERHISSFFQWYGSKPLRMSEVKNEFDTIIFKYSIKQLQEQFILELSNKSLTGYYESIDAICQELDIKPKNLNYNPNKQYGLYETDIIKLYSFSFDFLTANFTTLLTEITGTKIQQKNANIGKTKWYKDIYSEFKTSIAIPQNIVSEVYNHKRELINLFYPNNFEFVLNQTLNKYANK